MALSAEKEREVLVVMYHYVHDEPPAAEGKRVGPNAGVRGLSIQDFTAQLDQLCDAMEPIDWPTLYAWFQDRGDLPLRSFLITFDDGLTDHVRHAAPALERRGLRGTFFVPGQVLTQDRMLSAHAIHLLLSQLGDEPFELELRRAVGNEPGGDHWLNLLDCAAPPDARESTVYHYESPRRARLKTWLTLQLPIHLRRRVIDKLFECHVGPPHEWAQQWYLSRDDVSALSAQGHTIGGHGFVHEPLARMNEQEQPKDLMSCAQTITETVGSAVRPFSYPFGSLNDAAIEACRRAGFVHGFTTDSRPLRRSDYTMRLPRIDTIHLNRHLHGPRTPTACATAG